MLRHPVVLALPGLVLAVAGLFHPHHLTYATSERWYTLHLPALLLFPLVGWAVAQLVAGRTDPVAWLVRLAAYVYAVFYGALDVVNGIAAGYVTHRLGPGVPRPHEVSLMFGIGTPLGRVGSVALIVCVALVAVDRAVRVRLLAWPAVLLVVGAVLVHLDHIFSPKGVAGMALLGLGTALAAKLAPTTPARQATSEAPGTS